MSTTDKATGITLYTQRELNALDRNTIAAYHFELLRAEPRSLRMQYLLEATARIMTDRDWRQTGQPIVGYIPEDSTCITPPHSLNRSELPR